MKMGKWSIMVFAVVFTACNNQVEEVEQVVKVPEALEQVDNILSGFTASPQKFSTSGKQKSIVKGARGTIIHVDPSKLETVDGSAIGNTLDVSLLEIGDRTNMMLNGVTTMAGEDLLESGGAFFIKMWSKGIELKLKKDESLQIEFPKWSDVDMELFYGKMDSLGQIGWREAGLSFVEKNIAEPEKPVNPEYEVGEVMEGEMLPEEGANELQKPKKVKRTDVTKAEYESYLRKMQNYKNRLKEIELEKLTYDAVNVAKLGWINCDRFYKSNAPKARIDIAVENVEEISRARFYLVFKETNSVMAANYRKSDNSSVSFKGVPEGMQVVIIGVAARGEQIFLFNQEVTISKDMKLEAELMPASPEEVRRAISIAS